jgi:hypothetical protein
VYREGYTMTDELRIMDIDELPADTAPVTKQSDAEAQRLAGIIAEHGQLWPVVWNDRDNSLVFGREIIDAIKATGRSSVLVHVVSLGPVEHAARSIAMVAPYWKQDKDAIAGRVQYLAREGYDVDLVGLPSLQIEKIMGTYEPKTREPRRCPNCGVEISAAHAEHLVAV